MRGLTTNQEPTASHAPVARARRLRRDATDAETRQWRELKDRQLGVKFRRQFPFGPYILDFYCMDLRLVVEVDGGQHFEPENIKLDAERTAVLERSGLRVLRFTNREVLMEPEAVVKCIREAIEERKRSIPSL